MTDTLEDKKEIRNLTFHASYTSIRLTEWWSGDMPHPNFSDNRILVKKKEKMNDLRSEWKEGSFELLSVIGGQSEVESELNAGGQNEGREHVGAELARSITTFEKPIGSWLRQS